MFIQVRNSLSLSQKQPPQLVFDPPSAFRDMNGSTMTAMEFQTEAQKPEEKPVFSTRAHVFQIDPETKKSWLPCSRQAIPVMFYYDPNKETHRIISVDGSKAVINSTILPNMTFTKTSQKFGQWSDGRANTVFGLGFSSEAELNKFAEKFKEVKGSTRTASNSSSVTSNSSTGGNTNGGAMNGMSDSPISTPNVGHQSTSLKSGSSGSSGEDEMKDATGISHKPIGNTESQLKYENDRLKMALAQSSSNAKKWETELQTLKNNNARLTAALQESTTNVEEWKKQLNAYKEDNIRLRKKVQELETSEQVSEKFNSLQQEKLTLDGRVIQLDSMLRQRDEDIATLRQSNADLSNQNQILQIESEKLESKTRELTAQLSESSLNESRLKDLSELQKTLADKIQELTSLNTQLAASLQPRPPAPENS